jgi:site-specific DNA recombinase
MEDRNLLPENAVAAIRVSSVKQGTQGDSPEAQKEQIERFAESHNIVIKKFFVFLESASKEQQPMQEAIDYCKNPKNEIRLFIIKSIDRFTRGGSYSYDHLKLQLEKGNVSLIDIYGIIGSQKVNTLEHLGVQYNWSIYSPTQKAEILEAERAKDEMRDIMSRMIGAQIRYCRMGYWVRRAPYGFVEAKAETANGKRCVLEPHPKEAPYIIKMFELRAANTLDDQQIIEEVNKLGYKSRVELIRDKNNRSRIVAEKGGNPLDMKTLMRYIETPTYAGINNETWLQGNAIKMRFKGLVSIEVFNKANRGKVVIGDDSGEVSIKRRKPPEYLVKKGVRNPDFPYKKMVMCPHCEKPLFGSASRGRLGKYYPAYHCNKRGHYFRVTKADFDKTIESFVKSLVVAPERVSELEQAVLDERQRRQQDLQKQDVDLDSRIQEQKVSVNLIMGKLKVLSSETAIKYMEEELVRVEEHLATLLDEKEKVQMNQPIDMGVVMKYARYFLEHLEYLLLEQMNPMARAGYFGVVFDKAPTYQEIVSGTKDVNKITGVNELFLALRSPAGDLAGTVGFEPTILGPEPSALPLGHVPLLTHTDYNGSNPRSRRGISTHP